MSHKTLNKMCNLHAGLYPELQACTIPGLELFQHNRQQTEAQKELQDTDKTRIVNNTLWYKKHHKWDCL